MSLIQHPQLHEVLFTFLDIQTVFECRLLASGYAALVEGFALILFKDLLGRDKNVSSATSTYTNDDVLYPSARKATIHPSYVRLLGECSLLFEAIQDASQYIRHIGLGIFRGVSKVPAITFIMEELHHFIKTSHRKPPALPQLLSLDIAKVKPLPKNALKAVLLNSPQLTSLNLASCGKQIDDALLKTVAMNCKNLVALDVSDTAVTDDAIKVIVMNCRRIQTLALSSNAALSDVSIAAVASYCTNLRIFSVKDMSEKVGVQSLRLVAEKCQQLETVHLPLWDDDDIWQVLEAARGLKSIDSPIITQQCSVDGYFSKIASKFPFIERLHLANVHACLDDGLKLLSEKCRHVRVLDLSRCSEVTDDGVVAIAEGCPSLMDVNVSWTEGRIGDRSITAIALNRVQLERLNVSWTWGGVTDASIRAVADCSAVLKYIDVSRTKSITPAAIGMLGAKCCQLETVVLDPEYSCMKRNQLLRLFPLNCDVVFLEV